MYLFDLFPEMWGYNSSRVIHIYQGCRDIAARYLAQASGSKMSNVFTTKGEFHFLGHMGRRLVQTK
jgi:hypothetical protein